MRVIDANLGEVRAVAVSPDGRYAAASGDAAFAAFHWATGEPVLHLDVRAPCRQLAFAPHGGWVARGSPFAALRLQAVDREYLSETLPVGVSGGVAVAPDGKALWATGPGAPGGARLLRWRLPGLHPLPGFDFWSPCHRLAFSPDGEFLAGVWSGGFELRFANSGGLDHRHRTRPLAPEADRPGFVSFDRGSATCAFGWADEFHLLDVSTGTSKPGPRVEADFRDAAFLPGADRFATVGDDGLMRLWNPDGWRVTREYAWRCGPLTAVAFTADGSAGVCGTADGRLVQFDVDE